MPVTSKRAPSRTQKPSLSPNMVPRDADVETWRNATAGVVVINRTGEYGRRIHESIQGGRAFQITPQERRNMQNAVAASDLDPFTNGTLQPITLLDDEVDTEILLANPNVLDDKDLPRLLKLRGEQFAERINEISHLPTVTRLLALAKSTDYDMTVAQYEVLKLRERAIRARTEHLIEPDGPDTGEDTPKPVTPR